MKSSNVNQRCKTCAGYNCNLHLDSSRLKAQEFKELLQYFAPSSEEDMRIYTNADKSLTQSTAIKSQDTRIERIDSTFKSHASNLFRPAMQRQTDFKEIPQVRSLAIVPNYSSDTAEHSQIRVSQSSKDIKPKTELKLSKSYRALEHHKFERIHNASFVSCSSPTGLYSEISVVFWLFDARNTTADRLRVIVNLMYDSSEDLWCISTKMLKRSSYFSIRDEDINGVCNRLCTANELRSEIKSMLLYVGISPREAYMNFRRLIESPFITNNELPGLVAVESESHANLLKELERGSHSYQNTQHHGFPQAKDKSHNMHSYYSDND